jgi:hypothetical protein
LLVGAFGTGAVLGNLLWLQYGLRSAWLDTFTGKVMFALFGVIAVSYDLAVITLFAPHIFDGGAGLTVRLLLRYAIDGVLIGMYVLLVRAQRHDRALVSPRPEGIRQPPIE